MKEFLSGASVGWIGVGAFFAWTGAFNIGTLFLPVALLLGWAMYFAFTRGAA